MLCSDVQRAQDEIIDVKFFDHEKNGIKSNGRDSGEGMLNPFGCALSITGFGLAFAGLVTATGGAGLLIAAAGYSIAPASAALSCLT